LPPCPTAAPLSAIATAVSRNKLSRRIYILPLLDCGSRT
jgi:hypothetical protein